MVTIVVPSVWTEDRRSFFHLEEAGPLFELLERFVAQCPECRRRVMGPDGEPLMFLNVSVDDCLIPREERSSTVVPAGSTVILISPLAGG